METMYEERHKRGIDPGVTQATIHVYNFDLILHRWS